MSDNEEFFVGYLSTPPRLRSFSLAVGVVVLVAVGAIAWAAASYQDSPGGGVWDYSAEPVFSGLLAQDPYLTLHTVDDKGQPRAHLVVGQIKLPIDRQVAGFVGRFVDLKASTISRDTQTMLALSEAPDALTLKTRTSTEAMIRRRLMPQVERQVRLQGMIIDSKCYFGAMKPGAFVPHRGCAQQCIKSGIPPLLVTHTEDGAPSYFVLTDAEGGAFNREVLPYVAEPVEIRGTIVRVGGLAQLRVMRDGIRRR